MKILGLNKNGYRLNFIAELSDDELANLCLGNEFFRCSDLNIETANDLVGREVEIDKMWGMLYKYSQYRDNIEEVRKKLNSISDDLAFVKPFPEERKEE